MKKKPKMTKTTWAIFALILTAVVAWVVAAPDTTASELHQLPYEVVVVQAFFDDPALVAAVAAWKEPWEVDYNKNFIVLDVTAEEFDQLLLLGFDLVIEPRLTEQINRPHQMLPSQVSGIPGFPCYRTVEETYASAQQLAVDYPSLAEWVDIGDSWEKDQALGGFDLMVLRLTNRAAPGPKPKLFAMTAVHGREYTTAELNTRFAEYLLHNYDQDADVTWLLDHHEIHLLLQANPDGRKQAEMGQLWRKNTNQNYCSPTSNNRGADLNRNFQFQWGCCGGSSGNECSSTYRGPSAVSEPETQAIQNYVASQFPDLRDAAIGAAAPITTTGIFLDIHSYSELMLWPWGFTASPAANGLALQTLGRKLAYFNGYFPEQAIDLYPTDGTTDDFAYGELGLPAYTFELGTTFFQSCGLFQDPILPDNLAALLYAAKAVRAPYLIAAGPDPVDVQMSANLVAPGETVTVTVTLNDTRFENSNGTEPVQNILAAEYYLDVPDWITTTTPVPMPMVPADGAFDSPVEPALAVLDTSGLSQGRHTLFVRGQDSAGNWGVYSAAFLYLLDPAVAPTIQGVVTAADTSLPLTATITAGSQFSAMSSPVDGSYQMQVISGTYDLTAEPGSADYGGSTLTGLTAQDYQTVQADFMLYPYCAAFSDDFEAGMGSWTAEAPWAISTEAAHSPAHAWSDSPGGNYSSGQDVSLTSPVLDLSGQTGVRLDFWQICDTEAGYDFCRVEVSEDGGANWDEIAAFDGLSSQWEQVVLAAPALDNQPNARVRFRFTSDASVTEDGWHLDDVVVMGAGPNCLAPVSPQAGFTSSSPDILGQTTVFTNTSIGTQLAYEWQFGDNSGTVTLAHPTHVYTATGVYTVTLTATNELGSDTSKALVVVEEGIPMFLPVLPKSALMAQLE